MNYKEGMMYPVLVFLFCLLIVIYLLKDQYQNVLLGLYFCYLTLKNRYTKPPIRDVFFSIFKHYNDVENQRHPELTITDTEQLIECFNDIFNQEIVDSEVDIYVKDTIYPRHICEVVITRNEFHIQYPNLNFSNMGMAATLTTWSPNGETYIQTFYFIDQIVEFAHKLRCYTKDSMSILVHYLHDHEWYHQHDPFACMYDPVVCISSKNICMKLLPKLEDLYPWEYNADLFAAKQSNLKRSIKTYESITSKASTAEA